MADSSDANLQLKKRARRRLVGAIAFAGLAAVVLPMVMDEEPMQQVQDVQIRIPGQDQTPFNPKVAKPAPPPVSSEASPSQENVSAPPSSAVAAPKSAERPAEKPAEKAIDRTSEKKPEKPADKPPVKTVEKPVATNNSESRRALAILDGKTSEAAGAASANSGGQYVILIGAFSNPGNVKQLQTKIGELGIKVFTESLDPPDGKKTRVRAGPFASREAADKALGKMKKIGVNGVVTPKQ